MQAVLAAAGSSLVICVETSSTSQFELLSGFCCDIMEGASSPNQRASGVRAGDGVGSLEECSDCEDQRLAFASIERHDLDVPAPELSSGLWNALTHIGTWASHAGPQQPGLRPPERPAGGVSPGLLGRGLLTGVVLRR